MIEKIKLIFDKLLMWNAINWVFLLTIPSTVLLILLIIYIGIH